MEVGEALDRFERRRLPRLKHLLNVKKTLIRAELEAEDWHGVRDAATDIEVLEARIQEIERRG
jgi:hypothetical protein